MSDTKLKPCPFCGGEAIDYKGQVVCGKCYCGTGIMDTPQEAIELWNTRKPIDRIVEQLEEAKTTYEEYSKNSVLKGFDVNADRSQVMEYAIDIVKAGGKDE